MYYQNYEDYMQNVLGSRYTPEYTNQNVNPYNYYVPTYAMQEMNPNMGRMQELNQVPVSNNNVVEAANTNVNISISQETETVAKVKKMYPDIYVLLNPMIDKTIAENKEKEITEELIETMTKQIYDAIEDDMNVKQVSTTPVSVGDNKNRNINSQVRPVSGAVQTARRPQNSTLRDLIKILLINRILNNLRPNNRPDNRPRPPHRPDMRPPMPRGTSYPVMNYFQTPYPEDEYIV